LNRWKGLWRKQIPSVFFSLVQFVWIQVCRQILSFGIVFPMGGLVDRTTPVKTETTAARPTASDFFMISRLTPNLSYGFNFGV